MKAAYIEQFGLQNLKYDKQPEPELRPGCVLVKMEAVSLNYLDLVIIGGKFLTQIPMPHIPGCEGSGVIDAIGAGVTQWQTGDRVTIHYMQKWQSGKIEPQMIRERAGVFLKGLLAEYAVIPEYALVKTPATLTSIQACTLPVAGLTAWSGLVELAKIKPGNTVLTLGTGGVSIFALQIAKMMGCRVIAITSSAVKAEKLKDLGADIVINYKENPDWHKAIMEHTAGKGVDAVLDVVGGNTFSQCISAIKLNGFVGIVGLLENHLASFNIFESIYKAATIKVVAVGSKEGFGRLIEAINLNNIAPVIDKVYQLDEIEGALNYLKDGAHFGKIVIQI